MNKYMESFLSLRCAGDILNSVSKMSRAEKEITESMAIIKHLKNIVLAEPNKYTIIDLCAGNALTSVIAAHLLPITYAIAIDKHKRKGDYNRVKRFAYLEEDINHIQTLPNIDLKNNIWVSVHPCQTAEKIVKLFNKSKVHALIIMPCCHGNSNDIFAKAWLRRKLSEYDLWTYYLAKKIKNAKVKIVTDINCISPRNNIIVAVR